MEKRVRLVGSRFSIEILPEDHVGGGQTSLSQQSRSKGRVIRIGVDCREVASGVRRPRAAIKHVQVPFIRTPVVELYSARGPQRRWPRCTEKCKTCGWHLAYFSRQNLLWGAKGIRQLNARRICMLRLLRHGVRNCWTAAASAASGRPVYSYESDAGIAIVGLPISAVIAAAIWLRREEHSAQVRVDHRTVAHITVPIPRLSTWSCGPRIGMKLGLSRRRKMITGAGPPRSNPQWISRGRSLCLIRSVHPNKSVYVSPTVRDRD